MAKEKTKAEVVEEVKETPKKKTSKKSKKLYNPDAVVVLDKSNRPKDSKEDNIHKHELKNSFITKKVLSGVLSSIEKMKIGNDESISTAIVDYHGFRVIIPLSEMNIITGDDNSAMKQNKIMNDMIGCEIDFVVNGYTDEEDFVVASRKQAMHKKIKEFYIDKSSDTGLPVITEGTVAEARIVAVAETVLRVEVFGAECFVRVLDIDHEWMANARDKYTVGDKLLVRLSKVEITDEGITIAVESKSLKEADKGKCIRTGKYLGTITSVVNGTYFLRLNAGVNAIAHTTDSEYPLPKKKDKVAFVCTRFDEEAHVAIGIITRIVNAAK